MGAKVRKWAEKEKRGKKTGFVAAVKR